MLHGLYVDVHHCNCIVQYHLYLSPVSLLVKQLKIAKVQIMCSLSGRTCVSCGTISRARSQKMSIMNPQEDQAENVPYLSSSCLISKLSRNVMAVKCVHNLCS